jgi:hypothetical protein
VRLAIAALFIPMVLLSQNAQVSGLICDASGAALPGASITLTKLDNGTRYVSQSSAQGHYFIPATRPGLYKIRVRKDGFQTAVELGVRLTSGQNARIDVVLQIGMRQESVEVSAQKSLVDTEDSALRTTIHHGLIDNLPLNGRLCPP